MVKKCQAGNVPTAGCGKQYVFSKEGRIFGHEVFKRIHHSLLSFSIAINDLVRVANCAYNRETLVCAHSIKYACLGNQMHVARIFDSVRPSVAC